MDISTLDAFLFTPNIFEQVQYQTGESFNDIDELYQINNFFDKDRGKIRFPKSAFFKESNLYLSKHNRFASMVEHLHDFIEINYVYAGECVQYVNGKKVHLSTGSFFVLDRDVAHAIEPLGEKDILINILLNDQTFSSLFLYQLEKDQSLIGKFLSDAFSEQAIHDNYMVFDTQKAPQIHTQVQLMLCEYWSNEAETDKFVGQYLQLILSELMRIYREVTSQKNQNTKLDSMTVLDYIDKHYLEITLSDLEQVFNYSGNYISNTLKKVTGKNFQETVLEKKLLVAADLLKTSDLTIDEIAEVSGFNSTSYFYRQIKKKYQLTPKKLRKQLLTTKSLG
ncbi:AraC family transcriptional regulator [Enterococcus lemanii]|uniref:AraC family transcriptional regulator n=1 Tax=Enterococcus lemanii TaxID=1159752 RepID=A0ABV9MVE2_9ENTE|nr:AraC family transcriptional regulator [Enterococcus lemanii]MBM7710220.1 AraC-like DNA-binding protein [Enterococcus lemanii]